jgi:sulfoacetaldehyde acetyltransferase
VNDMTDAKDLAASTLTGGRVRMTPAEAFVETLLAHHVTELFGRAGPAGVDALDLLPAAGVRLHDVAHEPNAAHMAHGYSRVTNRPAVCVAREGPGMASFVPAIAAAYEAATPMVVVTAGASADSGPLPVLSRITKWRTHVQSPLHIAEQLHHGFSIAQRERGPVQVCLSAGCFEGEGDYEIRPPLAIERPDGGAHALERVARMLAAAKFPVIVAGGGVAQEGGMDDLKALAEHLSAPVVNAWLHNDSFPASHALACGPLGEFGSKAASRMLLRADVVLALGTCELPRSFDGGCGVQWIHVDGSPRAPQFLAREALAIEGDARRALAGLLKRLKARGGRPPDRARLADIEREKAAWRFELANWPAPRKRGFVAPRRALAELAKALPPAATVATDVGSMCALAAGYLRFDEPCSFLAATGAGGRGSAWPTALGAKVGRPDRPAIACVGDGAWSVSLAEVMAAVKQNIRAIAVVFNNNPWGFNARKPAATTGRHSMVVPPEHPDYSEIARAMGAEGYRVEHEDEVGDALKAALRVGKPAVVEILLTQQAPGGAARQARREPRRLLPKYRKPGSQSYRS